MVPQQRPPTKVVFNRGDLEGKSGTLEQILSATKGTNAAQTPNAEQASNRKKRHQKWLEEFVPVSQCPFDFPAIGHQLLEEAAAVPMCSA